MSIVKKLISEVDAVISDLDRLTEPINKLRSSSKDHNFRMYCDSLFSMVQTARANASLLRTVISIRGTRITAEQVEEARNTIRNLVKIASSLKQAVDVLLK